VAGLVLKELGRVPDVGDVAEVAVPGPVGEGDSDDLPQQLAVLVVERMEGLRIDRLSLRLLDRPVDGAGA
jgi:CBS domain containing-hemolysin-like protein